MTQTLSPDEGPAGEMSAKSLWEHQKETRGETNAALDQLMQLVGLENVKLEFLRIKAIIEAARERQVRLRRQLLNIAFLGNPGTGRLFNRRDRVPFCSRVKTFQERQCWPKYTRTFSLHAA